MSYPGAEGTVLVDTNAPLDTALDSDDSEFSVPGSPVGRAVGDSLDVTGDAPGAVARTSHLARA